MRLKPISASLLMMASISLLAPFSATGETWTDSTGQFTVEAEFKGVEGSSVVLLKDNGVTITVPIAKLSEESRALAKGLYDKMKGDGGGIPQQDGGANAVAEKTTIPPRKLDFEAPVPPTLSAMPAFPEDTSLQETVDFVKAQLEAGHLEVLWHALPQEMRDELDSPELRQAVNPFMQQQSQMLRSVEILVFKAIQVLTTKKEFVLGSSMMDQVPPDAMPMIQQGYDPAVGIVFEVADMGFRSSDLQEFSLTTFVDHYGPRIGGHMKDMMQLLPPQAIEMAVGEMKVEMIDENNGVIKAPETEVGLVPDDFEIEQEDIAMTRFMGRWIPTDLANEWPSMKEMMQNELQEALEAQQNSEDMQGAVMMVGMMSAMVGGVLDQLLAADSQEAFDQVLMQSAAMLAPNLGGGGAPAPGGLPPGGPGFGFGGGGFGEDQGDFFEEEDELGGADGLDGIQIK